MLVAVKLGLEALAFELFTGVALLVAGSVDKGVAVGLFAKSA